MDEKDQKIEELEQQIDDLLTEKYLNQQRSRQDDLIRKELEILVRSLYQNAREFLKSEDEPIDAREMLKNLTTAIEQFSKDYFWPLNG